MSDISENRVADLEKALLSLDRQEATRLIKEAADAGSPLRAASELVVRALEKIGEGWERGTYSLSQEYLAGMICEDAIDEILPPQAPQRKHQPRMAIGVFEDHHLLGKRILYSALRAGGWELTDLGSGLDAETVIRRVREDNIEVLLLSTLMLHSALQIRKLTSGLRDLPVKVIVGGAPFRFDEGLWREVGAHATGRDVADAVEIINQIAGGHH